MNASGKGSGNNESARTPADWQEASFAWTKKIPELNYASRFYARMLRRLRIYPALRDSNDRTEQIDSGEPVDLLDRIQDPGGGRSQILHSYGRLMFIAGEGYLFGRELETDNERWAFVSGKEVSTSDGKIIWRPTSSGTPTEYTSQQAVLYRMWTADPEKSGDPESPMRSAIEIAEELSILTKAVRSTAVTRMLMGILKVPAELSFGAEQEGLDDDPELSPLLRDFIEWATGVVENAGSPEAASPFIAEGSAEHLDSLDWLETHNTEKDYMEKDLRVEAIGRLAMGLDMPPELLKGMAEANHWGARQIMHDAWKSHGSGIAEQFCDDLAEAYLRPALKEAGFEDWRKIVVAYDDTDVVVSPDRSDDAHKVFQNLGLGWEGYRKQTGTPEEFKPSDEEMKILLAIRMREPAFLKGTKFEVEVPTRLPGPRGPAPDPSRNGNDAEEEPPKPGPAGVSRRESRSLAMHGAAETAILRCRRVAGARLRTHHRKSSDFARIAEIETNAHLAAACGQAFLQELDTPEPLVLVKNGAEDFVDICVEWGIEKAQAQAMGQMIEVYSAKTLFEEHMPDFPAGLSAAIEHANDISEEMIVQRNNESLARMARMIPGVAALAVRDPQEG